MRGIFHHLANEGLVTPASHKVPDKKPQWLDEPLYKVGQQTFKKYGLQIILPIYHCLLFYVIACPNIW